MKNYQTTTRHARDGRTTPKKTRPDAARAAHEAAVALPDTVTVAIAELAGELEEGLLAFVVGTGLKVLDVILEDEACALAGERGRHDPDRTAVRHGTDAGLVTLVRARCPSAGPECAPSTRPPRCSSPPTSWRRPPSSSDTRR